jgi:hypothetical protein
MPIHAQSIRDGAVGHAPEHQRENLSLAGC